MENKLTLIKELEVDYTDNLPEIITFLNKNLKKEQSLVFGLRKNDDKAVLTIYESQAWNLTNS